MLEFEASAYRQPWLQTQLKPIKRNLRKLFRLSCTWSDKQRLLFMKSLQSKSFSSIFSPKLSAKGGFSTLSAREPLIRLKRYPRSGRTLTSIRESRFVAHLWENSSLCGGRKQTHCSLFPKLSHIVDLGASCFCQFSVDRKFLRSRSSPLLRRSLPYATFAQLAVFNNTWFLKFALFSKITKTN